MLKEWGKSCGRGAPDVFGAPVVFREPPAQDGAFAPLAGTASQEVPVASMETSRGASPGASGAVRPALLGERASTAKTVGS